MKRREFCNQLAATGGMLLATSLISGCRPFRLPPLTATPTRLVPTGTPMITRVPPTATLPVQATPSPTAVAEVPASHTPAPTDTPAPTAQATMGPPLVTVALVRTTDRAAGVARALALLGVNPVRGQRVLLKPNYNSADAAPSSTHPAVLRAMLLSLQEMGAQAITIGERSGMGDTSQVLRQTGVFDLAAELGCETAVFDELDTRDWTTYQDSDFHWQQGFAIPKLLLDAQCIVQTCNLKTHMYGGHFTLSLKNSVGFVARTTSNAGFNYMSELHESDHQRQMIAEVNAAYAPDLIVIDGVDAFVDGGPAKGRQVRAEVVLAGSDRIALDAVGVALLRLWGTTREVSDGPIFEQAQIARAVELGLGIDEPTRIQFITDDEASRAYAEEIGAVLTAV